MKQFILTVLTCFCAVSASFAQFTTVASNLANPIGVDVDANGNAWVTESGTGNNDGRVTMISPNGTKTPIVTGLPSFFEAAVNETVGAWRIMRLPNNRMAVIIGGHETKEFGRILMFNMTGFQPGVSPAKKLTDTTSSIDIASFAVPASGIDDSDPFSAVLDTDGSWYVADAGANMIIKVTAAGVKSVFARFPPVPNPTPIGPPVVDAVPTSIIANPDGGFYVSTLTGFPFNVGSATIYNLSKTGVLSVYAKNLTTITDMVFDYRTGDLYALQHGTFGFVPFPGFAAGSAKVIRIQRGGANSEVMGTNFGPSVGMAFDATGNIYVTNNETSQLLKMNKPACANFEMSLTADNNSPAMNTSVKYTLKVTNKGTTNATNVRIYWLPPYKRFDGDVKPFAYQAGYASKGYYDTWHGYWTINNLAAGESATATFHLFVVNNQLDMKQTPEIGACNRPFPPFGVANQGDNQVAFSAPSHRDNLLPLSINPNPAYDKINVAITNETGNTWTVKLTNAVGQTVAVEKGQNSRTVLLDVRNVQNGLYFVDYQSVGEHKVEKVMVQH